VPIFGGGGTSGITSIVFGAGLSGGTITTSGTVGLAAIAAGDLLANTGTVSAVPIATPIGAGLQTSGGTVAVAPPTQQTIAATTTALITPPALPVSSALVNVGSTAVTLDINAGFVGQEIYVRIKQNGSTAHAVTLGTSFIDGLDITSFTSTNSAVADDLVRAIALSASQWALAAVNHGFTI
jgi:hypothetical protein